MLLSRFFGSKNGSKNGKKNDSRESAKRGSAVQVQATGPLSFNGLNPLLAKQLTELETQIGRFAQMQFEIGRERDRMRLEMAEIKKAVQTSARNNSDDQSATDS